MREARDKPQLLPGPGFPYLPHGGVGLAHCCGLSSPQCGLSAKLPAPPRGQHQPPPAVPAETRSAEVLGKARAKAGEKMEGGRLEAGGDPVPCPGALPGLSGPAGASHGAHHCPASLCTSGTGLPASLGRHPACNSWHPQSCCSDSLWPQEPLLEQKCAHGTGG